MADGKVVVDTDLDSSGFEAGLSKLGSLASTGLKATTASITAVGSGLLAMAGYAIKAGSDFEAAMSQVEAISGASGQTVKTASGEMVNGLDAITSKAKEMGANTKFSATESAEALNYMAMAGWDAQSMYEGLPGIMNLAAASGENLATTSDIVTDALTAFGIRPASSLTVMSRLSISIFTALHQGDNIFAIPCFLLSLRFCNLHFRNLMVEWECNMLFRSGYPCQFS